MWLAVAFSAGLALGGSFGVLAGLRRSGSTGRLRLNAVLNATSTHGPGLANRMAVITMFYCGWTGLIGAVRGQDDTANAAVAGALAGATFKANSGPLKALATWKTIGKYGLVCSGIYTAADVAFREGYL
eukprot:GHVT01033905.1.p1 GENE.GHVT01033905.1~~GHVT01033905.1.p1  ORF type:complete len:129 (+),score=22.81 GHVT01033905.1:99-485(+)